MYWETFPKSSGNQKEKNFVFINNSLNIENDVSKDKKRYLQLLVNRKRILYIFWPL